MIPDNILIFIIIFILIYVCEDSFFALFILFCFSSYELSVILTTITEAELLQMFLILILVTYSVLSMYQWTSKFNFDGTQKEREDDRLY